MVTLWTRLLMTRPGLRPQRDDVGPEAPSGPLPQQLGRHGLEGVLLLGPAGLVEVLLQVLARTVGDRPVSWAVALLYYIHALSYSACWVRDGYAAIGGARKPEYTDRTL